MARWLVDQVVPHLRADKSGGATGEQDRWHNPEFQHRETKPQNLWLKKLVGVEAAGETPSLTGNFVGETHRVLEHTQAHPVISTRKAQFACGQQRKWLKASWELNKQHCSLSDPSPIYSFTTQWQGLPHPFKYLRLCPLQSNRQAERKKIWPNWKNRSELQKKYN